jgi:hypothetical protein
LKRLITALALAVFAFPASALAVPADAPRQDHRIPSSSLGVPPGLGAQEQRTTPAIARHLPATGTDVAAADQQSPVGTSAPAPAPAVGGSDFDWGDAGIGAGSALALLVVSLGSFLTLRRRRIRLAG